MSMRAPVLLALAAALATAPAFAAVDPVRALALFREAAQLCGHDGGALWHQIGRAHV